MEPKIKISLPALTLALLKKDCEDFRIVKSDGTPNFNAFVNLLVANFIESFSAGEEALHDDIRSALNNLPERFKDEAFLNVVKVFAKRNDGDVPKKESATFSFKPNKTSQKAVMYIQNTILPTESLSSYYRRMFECYAQKTKNEREKIIHAENYALLQKALRKGQKVIAKWASGEVTAGISLHSVEHSKDELFNYVLFFHKRNETRRLANLVQVTLTSEKASMPDKNRELFNRQVACAVQYPMYSTDDEPIKVQLTEKGKKLFEKIYLYRPTPVSVEGDVYTFDCSGNQLLYYFERFGDTALILSPKRLGVFMRDYHYFALKKYRSIYK